LGINPKGLGSYTVNENGTSTLPTHSQIVYGNLVDTCGPYSRDYMSVTYIEFSSIISWGKGKAISFC